MMNNIHDLIDMWWEERLAAGCQFAYPLDTKKGIDYKGDKTWRDWVSNDALLSDFRRWAKLHTVSNGVFISAFRQHVEGYGIPQRQIIEVSLGGGVSLRPEKAGFKFNAIPDHLTNGGY